MRNAYKVITIGLLAACLLLGGLLLAQSGYRRADAALSEWSLSEWAFSEAAQSLRAVPSFYRDTRQLRQYAQAGELFHQGEYEQAKIRFRELGQYRDAALFLPECDYRQAAGMLRGGQPLAARLLFISINGYRDSTELLLACDYEIAKAHMSSEEYDKARPLFAQLSQAEYLDSATLLLETDYRQALAYKQSEYYYEALQMLKDLDSYSNAPAELHALQEDLYRQAQESYDGYLAGEDGSYLDCVWLFSLIQEYADSPQYLEMMNLTDALFEQPVFDSYAERADYHAAHYKRLLALWASDFSPALLDIELYYLDEFLEGRWKGDGKSLRVTISRKNGDVLYTHDLPGSKSTEIKTEDGVLYFGSREADSWVKMYEYKLIDPDTVAFYAYSNSKTYTLKRQ